VSESSFRKKVRAACPAFEFFPYVPGEYSRAGTPDTWCCGPGVTGAWVEFKGLNTRVSKLQELTHSKMRRWGALVIILREGEGADWGGNELVEGPWPLVLRECAIRWNMKVPNKPKE